MEIDAAAEAHRREQRHGRGDRPLSHRRAALRSGSTWGGRTVVWKRGEVKSVAIPRPIRYPTRPFARRKTPRHLGASTPRAWQREDMRENIHPAYPTAKVHCA